MNENFFSLFEQIEDPREDINKKHELVTLIFIVMLAVLSGYTSYRAIEDFGISYEEELAKYVDLTNGIPTHVTFARVFSRINSEQFQAVFIQFVQMLAEKIEGVIPIDGKTIRNSGKNPIHMVTAWSTMNSLVLGQLRVEDKSNEIVAIPKLLELLSIEGCIITIDAMGCQKNIAEQIIDQKGDYILALKANHPSLFQDVKDYFSEPSENISSFTETIKEHGRIEKRVCEVREDISYLQEHHNWKNLRTIAKLTTTKTIKNKKTEETRWYISSLPACPERIAKAVQQHWEIENKLHWVLDVTFNQDKACITKDNGPENMDIIMKFSLNILNNYKNKNQLKQSIKSLQRRCAMSFNFLVKILNSLV